MSTHSQKRTKDSDHTTPSKKVKGDDNVKEGKQEEVEQKGVKGEDSSIVEKGHIYFFYRPKVQITEVKGFDDVQKLYILLCPTDHSDTSKIGDVKPSDTEKRKQKKLPNRLITIPKKKLPSATTHAKFWGFVSKVDFDIEKIHHVLDEEHHHTETRGERTTGASRPAGEGFYSLVHHASKSKAHTHLVYALEVPNLLGEVQKAFNIEKEGSMVLSVKNPKKPAPEGAPHLSGQAHLSKEEQKEFHGRKFTSGEPTFLDHEGTELIIIGASKDLQEEFGVTGKKIEKAEEEDLQHCRSARVKLYDELKFFDNTSHKIKPLLEGAWQ